MESNGGREEINRRQVAAAAAMSLPKSPNATRVVIDIIKLAVKIWQRESTSEAKLIFSNIRIQFGPPVLNTKFNFKKKIERVLCMFPIRNLSCMVYVIHGYWMAKKASPRLHDPPSFFATS